MFFTIIIIIIISRGLKQMEDLELGGGVGF